MDLKKSWKAELAGRDLIEVVDHKEGRQVHFLGCASFMKLVLEFKSQYGKDPAQWPLPTGASHQELLVKELILKVRGQWAPPFTEDEICHCRNVSRQTVEEAILNGAQTPELVSRWTSASTSCGTCRPDVEALINYWLGNTLKK